MTSIDLRRILGRELKVPDHDVISEYFHGKVVLVTGAGGSIGSEICAQLIEYKPAKLVMLDSSEFNLYSVDQRVRSLDGGDTAIETIMGSATSRRKVNEVFRRHRPECVLHAAAYKHVPLVEANPAEGILNNLLATRRVTEAAIRWGTRRFLLISSDKAVNPTNVMGATKRCCELMTRAMHQLYRGQCRFCAVRFGNVMGSSGSVVPLFLSQIAKGGPVTVTDPEVTRYFMLIPEAVGLVLQSLTMERDGETFILDMGDPVRIVDLAERVIRECGKVPREDIDIRYVGLRPGEKLYEELILEGDERPTSRDDVFIAHPEPVDPFKTLYLVDALLAATRDGNTRLSRALMGELVPQYVAGWVSRGRDVTVKPVPVPDFRGAESYAH